ncbi:hypothetical protein BDP55DRAFT_720981, partial [Colletotrichum godetiae]
MRRHLISEIKFQSFCSTHELSANLSTSNRINQQVIQKSIMLISITPKNSATSNLPMTSRSPRYSVLSRNWTPGSSIQFAPPPTTKTHMQNATLPFVSRLCATTRVKQQDFPKQAKLQAKHIQRFHVKQTGGFCGTVLFKVLRTMFLMSLTSSCPLSYGLSTISIGGIKEDVKDLVACLIFRLISTNQGEFKIVNPRVSNLKEEDRPRRLPRRSPGSRSSQSPDPLSVSAITPPAILRCPKRALIKTEEIDLPGDATVESDVNDSPSGILKSRSNLTMASHPHAHRYKKAKTPFDIEEVIAKREAEREANRADAESSENISTEDGVVFFSVEEATPPPEQLPDYHPGAVPNSSHTARPRSAVFLARQKFLKTNNDWEVGKPRPGRFKEVFYEYKPLKGMKPREWPQ